MYVTSAIDIADLGWSYIPKSDPIKTEQLSRVPVKKERHCWRSNVPMLYLNSVIY